MRTFEPGDPTAALPPLLRAQSPINADPQLATEVTALEIAAEFPWQAVVFSGLVAFAAQPLVLRVLRARDILDLPNERSLHSAPVPRGGGWGIVLSAVTVAIAGDARGELGVTLPVAFGCLLAAAVGGIDDIRGLPAGIRLVLQAGMGALVADLVVGSGPAGGFLVGVAVAVIVVGYVNAFNFMDGINGISAISGGVTGAWLAGLATMQADPALAWLAAGVAGSCLGFLPWNFPVARLFMGDIGSYFLGVTLAALALAVWKAGAPMFLCVAPFVPYLFDTAATLFRRARRRERLTQAHREHMYQQLALREGHVMSTLIVTLVTVGCLAAAVIAEMIGWVFGVATAILLCGLYRDISRREGIRR